MRLQKYMAHCGIASRRKCEEFIQAGRVSINGSVITELGTSVDPEHDSVYLDGKLIGQEKPIHILFYKPAHVVCTSFDPQGRQTIQEYFKDIDCRLYSVGRLDYDTEGLLIVTNDGELTNLLAHPSKEVDKTYYAICNGAVEENDVRKLQEGIEIDGMLTASAKVKILEIGESITRLLITIHEGRNRQIRQMLSAVGHEVVFLRRERFGSLTLEGVSPGKWRFLTTKEVNDLRVCAGVAKAQEQVVSNF